MWIKDIQHRFKHWWIEISAHWNRRRINRDNGPKSRTHGNFDSCSFWRIEKPSIFVQQFLKGRWIAQTSFISINSWHQRTFQFTTFVKSFDWMRAIILDSSLVHWDDICIHALFSWLIRSNQSVQNLDPKMPIIWNDSKSNFVSTFILPYKRLRQRDSKSYISLGLSITAVIEQNK